MQKRCVSDHHTLRNQADWANALAVFRRGRPQSRRRPPSKFCPNTSDCGRGHATRDAITTSPHHPTKRSPVCIPCVYRFRHPAGMAGPTVTDSGSTRDEVATQSVTPFLRPRTTTVRAPAPLVSRAVEHIPHCPRHEGRRTRFVQEMHAGVNDPARRDDVGRVAGRKDARQRGAGGAQRRLEIAPIHRRHDDIRQQQVYRPRMRRRHM